MPPACLGPASHPARHTHFALAFESAPHQLPTDLESASRLNGSTVELDVLLLAQLNVQHKFFCYKPITLRFNTSTLFNIYLVFHAVCVMPLHALVFERRCRFHWRKKKGCLITLKKCGKRFSRSWLGLQAFVN